MTVAWRGKDLADAIEAFVPGSVNDLNETDVWVSSSSLVEVAGGLRDRPEFRFDLLSSLTAVDYIDHFEVVYHLHLPAAKHESRPQGQVRLRA